MEMNPVDTLKINHLVSDRTEDVVRLDSAATISADLTEATNEDQKVHLRHAERNVSLRGGENRSRRRGPWNGDEGNDSREYESQNDRSRTHEVLPVSTDDKKCWLFDKVTSMDCLAH